MSFICGTRRVVRRNAYDFRVVCATCMRGGTVRHWTKESACKAATRDSNKPCKCGAA